MRTILETPRLILREMTEDDFPALCRILCDGPTMYAYEGAFSEGEAREWLERQQARYAADGFGLWAVVRRETGEMIGQCGLTWQDWDGRRVPEIGYLFERAHWHRGYAAEAARGCRTYAFETLGMDEVYSIIRDTNAPSQAVARRGGMAVADARKDGGDVAVTPVKDQAALGIGPNERREPPLDG